MRLEKESCLEKFHNWEGALSAKPLALGEPELPKGAGGCMLDTQYAMEANLLASSNFWKRAVGIIWPTAADGTGVGWLQATGGVEVVGLLPPHTSWNVPWVLGEHTKHVSTLSPVSPEDESTPTLRKATYPGSQKQEQGPAPGKVFILFPQEIWAPGSCSDCEPSQPTKVQESAGAEGGAAGAGGVQVLSQASMPRPLRIFDRSHTLVQLTLRHVINEPDGISTSTLLPPLQHPTSTQTSSNPSLEMVPRGLAQRSLFVANGRQVPAASRSFVYSTIGKTAALRYFIAVYIEVEK